MTIIIKSNFSHLETKMLLQFGYLHHLKAMTIITGAFPTEWIQSMAVVGQRSLSRETGSERHIHRLKSER